MRIRRSINLLMLLLALGISSCSHITEKTNKAPVIGIDPDQSEMTAEDMAQHFTNDRLVVLRGTMLGRIDRIIDWGDRFVIFDYKEQQAVIFDTTGNSITQIKR